MKHTVIEKVVTINAPVEEVWCVFTDPVKTKQMGGYYDTDWTPGSSFGFRNTAGNRLTNGILLELEPLLLIRHNLLDPDDGTVQAVITYLFRDKEGRTVLTGREVVMRPLEQADFEDAAAGWEFALNAVKELAEKR